MTAEHRRDPRTGRRAAVRADRAAARRRRRLRRRAWAGFFAVVVVLVAVTVATGGVMVDPFAGPAADARPVTAGSWAATAQTAEPTALSPFMAAPPPTTPPPTRTAPDPPVLRLSGDFPDRGPGEFDFHPDDGPEHGTGGPLRRFRLAVERGGPETVDDFAETVDAALGDARGWTARGDVRLRRVAAGTRYDFTIYLATPETARRLCASGGVDIRIGGVPYTSCRVSGKVIINLSRWRRSVPDYVEAEVPLAAYRLYVVNHEVGHQLGRGHEPCPGRGRPAPVMHQQTLGLDGCRANSWPYPDRG